MQPQPNAGALKIGYKYKGNKGEGVCAGFKVICLDHIPVFLNRRAAARYRALASIIPGREKYSWNLSF
jgi:hypothetical protein